MKARRLRAAILLSLIPGLLGLGLIRWPPTEGLERIGLDLMFRMRGALDPPPSVVVVAIDKDSYDAIGLDSRFPWPREIHAELIRTLHEEGAKAIAFDVLFEEQGEVGPDTELEWALEDTGIVVLGASIEQLEDPRFRRAQIREPYGPFSEAAASLGLVNLPRDPDDVIRSTWLVPNGRPGLALAAYELATGDESKRQLGTRLIDYYGPARTIKTVSLYQALDPDQYLPDGFFNDKLVFVGLSEQAAAGSAAKDAFATPYRGASGETTFGVEIHATIAANLIEDREIRLLPTTVESLILVLLPLVAMVLFIWLGPLYGAVAFIVLLVVPWVSGYVGFSRQSLWLPTVIPFAIQLPVTYTVSVIWYYMTTVRERERVKSAFSRYLSPEAARQVAEDPSALNLGGAEIQATVMFTDIAGFTSIAESMTAEETAKMLNRYFSNVTKHVFETNGTLVKYIGDAVFAIWGAPIHFPDHAKQGCLAAAAIAELDAEQSEQALSEDDPLLKLTTRIGVHTGRMLVGNLGSSQRFDYTAIGDSVNLAARIEGINKMFKTRAIISGETYKEAQADLKVRRLGRVKVVGRAEPVELFELITQPVHPKYNEGLELFEKGQFPEAKQCFLEVLKASEGKDGPSDFYSQACDRYENSNIDKANWNGVIEAESK